MPTRRARLATVDYIATDDTRPAVSEPGLLLEDMDDTARTLGGKQMKFSFDDSDRPQRTIQNIDPRSLSELFLFQILIGNWDWGLFEIHAEGENGLQNVEIVKTREGKLIPVAEDFDLSKLVVGPASWSDTVSHVFEGLGESLPPDFLPGEPLHLRIQGYFALEALAWVTPASLTEAMKKFRDRIPAMGRVISSNNTLDEQGRSIAMAQLDLFEKKLLPLLEAGLDPASANLRRIVDSFRSH